MTDPQQYSDEAQEAIKQLAAQHDSDPEDVAGRYAELLEEEGAKGVSDPERRALRRLSLDYKGGQMQGTETLQGYVLGASDPINTSASAINRAKNYVKNNGVQKAVKQGLIKRVPNGLPDGLASVDVIQDGETETYAVLDSNSNSPTSGEILPAEDWIRYAYGAVWRAPDDGPHWFSGVINGDEEGDIPATPPKHEPVKFEAAWIGESDQNNTIRLRFQDEDPFEPSDQFGGPGVIETIEDELGLVDLEDANADRYDRNDVVAVYGSVTYMELSPDEGQNRRLSLVDPFAFGSDLRRTVWLNGHVEVDFAEESDVYVVGQVSKSSDPEYPDNINALGVFAHPDYRINREDIESMADSDGEDGHPDGSPAAEGEPLPAEDEEDEEDEEEPEQPDPGVTPAEAGAKGLDPSEANVKESESDDQEAEDEDQPPLPWDADLPPVIEEANYTELRSVAADVEEVPGSGISEEDLLEGLVMALGEDELGRRLIEGAGNADEGDTTDDTEGGSDDAGAEPEPEPDETATADGGESVSDEDQGGFEPTDEDEDWEW